jgi:hypothetical protein
MAIAARQLSCFITSILVSIVMMMSVRMTVLMSVVMVMVMTAMIVADTMNMPLRTMRMRDCGMTMDFSLMMMLIRLMEM